MRIDRVCSFRKMREGTMARRPRGMTWALGMAAIAAGMVARGDDAIPGIGPKGGVVRVQTGFAFTEGPTADAQGNLYFTDVRANRILKLDTASGALSTFLEDSQGANGLGFDGAGRLIVAQGGARRVIAIDVATKRSTVLADAYDGRPFARPNDL